MRAARKKPDGRRHNHGVSRGLSEASKLVTGPAALFAAVEARARALGVPVAEAWRMAAREWVRLSA